MALRWEDMLLGAAPHPSLVFRRWRSPLRGWHCYFRRCESQSLWCGRCRKSMKKLVHMADVAWKIRTLVAPCWCMFSGQRLVNANPHVDFPQVNDNWTSCSRVMTSFLKVDPLSERSGIPDTFFVLHPIHNAVVWDGRCRYKFAIATRDHLENLRVFQHIFLLGPRPFLSICTLLWHGTCHFLERFSETHNNVLAVWLFWKGTKVLESLARPDLDLLAHPPLDSLTLLQDTKRCTLLGGLFRSKETEPREREANGMLTTTSTHSRSWNTDSPLSPFRLSNHGGWRHGTWGQGLGQSGTKHRTRFNNLQGVATRRAAFAMTLSTIYIILYYFVNCVNFCCICLLN